jgi:hypothetical protein
MTKKRKLDPSAAAQCKQHWGMDLDDLHLYDGRSSRSSRGERAEKGKEKWPPSITPRKKEKKKREDGPQPPLEVGSKMECAGPKVDQRAPPLPNGGGHLSTLIRWNFFLYFFAALRDFERNFSLLLFRCFER